MTAPDPRFAAALAAIDAANAEDPARDAGGRPAALVYGERMSAWLDQLDGAAPPELRLACRAQHIRRWTQPRAAYPAGKAGYYLWRTRLAAFHAQCLDAILRDAGYDDAFIARARSLVQKQGLKTDPQAQTLEDAACLVFLETAFAAFAAAHDRAQVIDILRKTWRKMSPHGQAAAQGLAATLPADAQGLLAEALGAG